MPNPSPHSLDTLLEEFDKKFIKTNERGDIPVPPEIVKRWVKKALTQAYTLGVEAAGKITEEEIDAFLDAFFSDKLISEKYIKGGKILARAAAKEIKKRALARCKALTSLKPKD